MNVRDRFKLLATLTLLVAGCSSLPGLRVLTGQDTTDNADLIVSNIDLVMADKSGSSDPSLIAAANRIEAAAGNGVDIIEIRQNLDRDAFVVNLLVPPPPSNSQEDQVAFNTNVRRALELTWQGVLPESEGSDVLQINVLFPNTITTLDRGRSVLGVVVVNSEIARSDAVAYLSSARSVNNFVDLIIDGTLIYESTDGNELYQGEPNHPLFMFQNG